MTQSSNLRASVNAAETPFSHTPSSALSLRPRVCVCVRVRVFSGCPSQQRQRHYLNSFTRLCRHLPAASANWNQTRKLPESFILRALFSLKSFLSQTTKAYTPPHHVCRDAAVQHKCGKGERLVKNAVLTRHCWPACCSSDASWKHRTVFWRSAQKGNCEEPPPVSIHRLLQESFDIRATFRLGKANKVALFTPPPGIVFKHMVAFACVERGQNLETTPPEIRLNQLIKPLIFSFELCRNVLASREMLNVSCWWLYSTVCLYLVELNPALCNVWRTWLLLTSSFYTLQMASAMKLVCTVPDLKPIFPADWLSRLFPAQWLCVSCSLKLP